MTTERSLLTCCGSLGSHATDLLTNSSPFLPRGEPFAHRLVHHARALLCGGTAKMYTCSVSNARTGKLSGASAWPRSGSAPAPMSSPTGSPKAFRDLKVRRASHCETLQVSVAFAVVEQAFEEF